MGKTQQQLQEQLQENNQNQSSPSSSSSFFCCGCCSDGFLRIRNSFSFKCLFVLFLTVALFVSVIFWIPPFSRLKSGAHGDGGDKLNVAVKARFRLQKPVSFLSAYTETLENDLLGEIGMLNTKISILSMHQAAKSNWTDVVFGVLPDPNNVPINLVSLSVLRSSLVELFLQKLNLSLTTSIFGKPSSFEILEFPGGINVVPMPSGSMFKVPQILFNFTLNNSIGQIDDSLDQLTDQLKFGLRLRPYENAFVQLKNVKGSTVDPPVIVEASVLSDGSHFLRPERLKQLAETIKRSPRSRNLGLDHSVFGKVKEIRLSSILDGTLGPSPSPTPTPTPTPTSTLTPTPTTAPTSSPSPSPSQFQFPSPSPPPSLSPFPSPSPISSPAPSDDHQDISPCSYCGGFPHAPVPASAHQPNSPPFSLSPAPSHPCPHSAFSPSPVPAAHLTPSSPPSLPPRAATLPSSPTPASAPGVPPSPTVSNDISPAQDKRTGKASGSPTYDSPLSPAPSSSVSSSCGIEMWPVGLLVAWLLLLLCEPYG